MYDCPAVGASSPQGGGTEIVSWAPALPFPWLLLSSHQLHSVQALPRTHCHGICETQARPGGKSVFNFWPASLVPQPSVLGVGASMVMQPAQHPGSPSRTVGGGPQVPPVGVREPSGQHYMSGGTDGFPLWDRGPSGLRLGEPGLWLIHAEPALCMLS